VSNRRKGQVVNISDRFRDEPVEKPEEIKKAVRNAYASLATSRSLPMVDGCCEPSSGSTSDKLVRYGYSEEELRELPESVITMSDGCGNPTGLGMIKEGETVLDLGSGGGIDVFLASKKVGPRGRVVGLDMTPEMIQRARENAKKAGLTNVEFKLGEMETIPLGDGSVDVIMSNCVICLSPDKQRVSNEMFRVLKPGGRLAIADEVAVKPFTPEERADSGKWCSCVSGAITEAEYKSTLEQAGFGQVYVKQLRPAGDFTSGVFSAFVSAVKPPGSAGLS
jgi:arsenite methyltransferase